MQLNEDPYLYRTPDGFFHAVFHGMNPFPSTLAVGRHAFSLDGLTWQYSMVDAWSTTVKYTDGTTVKYDRRERPELMVGADGWPAHLVTGVVDSTGGGGGFRDRSFTLVQPVATNGTASAQRIGGAASGAAAAAAAAAQGMGQ
jgi:hypothetical protein